MATKIQIWNRAARAAGETQRIESDTEATPVVSVLADVYDDLVREVMAAKEWAWAITQLALTEITDQSISYVGDGAKTVFTVPYDIGDASQLDVMVNSVESVLGTNYTFAPSDGGYTATVTFAVAPAIGAAITLTVSTTRVGWNFVYALPDDCLRPLRLLHASFCQAWPSDGRLPHWWRQSFVVMPNNSRTGYVLCTETEDFDALEYVALITDESAWPPHFVEAVVRRIAAHLLDALKKSPAEAQAMLQSYRAALSEANAVANNSTGDLAQPLTPALRSRW